MAKNLEARLTDGTVRNVLMPGDVSADDVFMWLTGMGQSRWEPEGEWLPTEDSSMIRKTAIIEVRVVETSDEPLIEHG